MSELLGVFRALDHWFSIEVDGHMPVDPLVIFGDLRADGVPQVAYRFEFGATPGNDDGHLLADGVVVSSGRARASKKRKDRQAAFIDA